MGISKEEAIKELQNRETVFVAYSQATKLPYVKCDEETYNDQAWIFSTEEGIKEFTVPYNGMDLKICVVSGLANARKVMDKVKKRFFLWV